MLNTRYKKAAGEYICIEGKKGWFISKYNNCLCEVDFSERKGRLLSYLGYTDEALPKMMYYGVIKYNETLYLFPGGDNHIIECNLNGDVIKKIELEPLICKKQFHECGIKFRHAFIEDRYIYFLGCDYPAIIRLDVQSDQLDYITDWVEDIDSKVKNNRFFGYFTEGHVVKNDKIYLPLGRIPGILELDSNSLKSRLICVDTEAGGFAGITQVADEVCCLSGAEENANRIILWDMVKNVVQKEIPFKSLYELTNPLHQVICIKKKIYMPILTWAFDKVQEYNLETGEISENESLNQLDYLYTGEYLGTFAMMSVFLEDNEIIHFATGKDLRWHEYNTATDILEDYDIFFEGSEEIYKQIFAEKSRVCASAGEILKENEFPLRGLIDALMTD